MRREASASVWGVNLDRPPPGVPPFRTVRPASVFLRCLAVALVVAAAGILIFSEALGKYLSHDENQFIAPAALIARDGLLPYRDYALLHVPTQVLLFAGFDKIFGQILLPARLFCGLCGLGIVGLLGAFSDRLGVGFAGGWRALTVLLLGLLLVMSSVYTDSVGEAWNHDFPILLIVSAFLLHLRSAVTVKPGLTLALSGLAVGLAIGSRLSFAPVLAPFGLGILLLPGRSWGSRAGLAAIFSGAVIAGLLPTLFFAVAYPEQFYFGNFVYPKFSKLWRDMGFPMDTSGLHYSAAGILDPDLHSKPRNLWANKFRNFSRGFVLKNAPLVIAFLLALPFVIRQARQRNFRSLFLLLLLPFVIYGCFAPTRYHEQYFYAAAPFLILTIACALPALPQTRATTGAVVGILFAGGVATALMNKPWENIRPRIFTYERWQPVIDHEVGVRVREHVGEGRVLTITPGYVTEGGVDIYPELATGSFAWRTSQLVSPEKRKRLRIISPEDLEARLAGDPPAAVLLRHKEPNLEEPLLAYAKAHGYAPIEMAPFTLWMAPSAPAAE